MPRYELALILKAMQRPEVAATLKRRVEALLERGAVVRKLENLGERTLLYKISKHNQRHTRGGLMFTRSAKYLWDSYFGSCLTVDK
ncbi:small ribosomal subunit protein bS6m-like [Heteronotia binoei]|uniref:small ribosomal subunit protein bS6m-like n=1 Tax=Heteronotia binoei TaxID=13085 RepID=UPI00292F1E3A|nr:small ribosomal subunit protein bS6m-like [Heteronotia binoei]